MNVSLNKLATLLKLHPRTVLRAAERKTNPYWVEGFDTSVDLEKVARAFSSSKKEAEQLAKTIRRVLRGNDRIVTGSEAADELGVTQRTFRYRRYPACIRKQTIVRYSMAEVCDFDIENFSNE